MPRIQGIDIPNDKPTHVSLRYIRGIGPTTALELCKTAYLALGPHVPADPKEKSPARATDNPPEERVAARSLLGP